MEVVFKVLIGLYAVINVFALWVMAEDCDSISEFCDGTPLIVYLLLGPAIILYSILWCVPYRRSDED